jgi:hypothetical protein
MGRCYKPSVQAYQAHVVVQAHAGLFDQRGRETPDNGMAQQILKRLEFGLRVTRPPVALDRDDGRQMPSFELLQFAIIRRLGEDGGRRPLGWMVTIPSAASSFSASRRGATGTRRILTSALCE